MLKLSRERLDALLLGPDLHDPGRCRTDALGLDGGRGAARRDRGRVPRVAVPVVRDEEGRREDVARAGVVLLDRDVGLDPVPVAVDEEDRAVGSAGDRAHQHALEPLERLLLERLDVLGADHHRLRVRQHQVDVLPGLGRHHPARAPLPHPALGQRHHGGLGKSGGQRRIDLAGDRAQSG